MTMAIGETSWGRMRPQFVFTMLNWFIIMNSGTTLVAAGIMKPARKVMKTVFLKGKSSCERA